MRGARLCCGKYGNREIVLQYLFSMYPSRGRIRTEDPSGDNGHVGVDELAVLYHLGGSCCRRRS